MILLSDYRNQWFSSIRGDVFVGVVVAFALIPEAIVFSIIAGMDPQMGLYASFLIAALIAFVSCQPGMISATTAAIAVLMITLVRDHGLEYLLAAIVLAGLLQISVSLLKLGCFMRYVSKLVMTGLVNALVTLIFMAQLPELDLSLPDMTWLTWVLMAAALAIIYLFPRLITAIPCTLVTIVVLTVLVWMIGRDMRTVGNTGALPNTLTLETLLIVYLYAAAVVVVGLLESVMTQNANSHLARQ